MNQVFQQIIVGAVLIAVVVFVVSKIWGFFKNKDQKTLHNCDNCTGCDLKEIIKNNQKECNSFRQVS
ncbi:MAG: FeoB-associated Cys-rich membrane protein [Prevotellaceae bacterium]|jgi:hypothetical protein|nr:FeoB-associated Cys-rich membrane protein [Prevotellaceae bacterium]